MICPDRLKQLKLGAATLVGLVLIMSPWWARNAAISGRFIPTTSQVGVSLYDGLSPKADGGSDMEFVEQFVEELKREGPAADNEMFENRLDRLARSRAIDWAAEHPGRSAYLAGVKFSRMWNIWPNEPSLSAWPIRLGIAVIYVPVFILGILGALRTIGRGWPYVLCWIPAVYLTLLHIIFVSSIRYRQPAMFGLIVLAAGVLAIWGSWGYGSNSCGRKEL